MLTAKDERQNTTTFSSYKNGIPQTIQLPGTDGATITQEVNDTGTIKSITNARLNKTSYEYDERNRLKTVTPPIGSGTTITWARDTTWTPDGKNQQKTITTGTSQTVNHYDGFGRLIKTDATDTSRKDTIVKTYSYDSVGRLAFESYPNDTNGLKYDYDALDRRWQTTRMVDNKTTQITFSSPETQTTKDFNGHYTTSTFVSYGAPSFEQFMSSSTAYTGKDGNGNPTSGTALTSYQRDMLGFANSVSQGGITRGYGLDSKRQLTTEYLPEVGVAANSAGFNVGYCRDDAGNLIKKWVGIPNGFSCGSPPTGPLFANTYDARNRLTNVSFADVNTPDVSIPSYTATDKAKTIIKGSVEIDMDYDAAENLQYEIFKIDGYQFRIYYTYDSLNHLSSIQYPSGKTLQLSPDAFGRSRAITGTLNSVDYFATGLPSTIAYANGEVTSITPTPQNYVDTIITLGPSDAVSLNYGYDDNGNVTSVVDALRSGDGMQLGYDELNRQISTQYPNATPGVTYRRGYDPTGNVMFDQTPERALTMSYDTTYNRLSSVNGSGITRSLNYDGLGNMTSDGVRGLTFDKAGNLQSSQNPVIKQFKYDGRNRVISETTSQGTKYYVYSGEKLMFEYAPYNQTYTEYVYLKRQLVGTRVVTNVAQADIDKFHGLNWSPQ
jgi:YD repeat-containing protein